MTDESRSLELPRVESGIPGLDVLLRGGFLRGGLYLISGRPGAGKTIFGNQVCYEHAARGGRALYVTLLTESHARMLACLRPFSFFQPDAVGGPLSYLSAYQVLETEKLPGLLKLLRRVLKDHRASLLVIDGLVTAGAMASSDLEFKKFLHELQVLVELVGCTVLMLTGSIGGDSHYAERTMVDGLIHLSVERAGLRALRRLEVTKFRGSDVLLGEHYFDIGDEGIRVHPRVETVIGTTPPPATERRPMSLGIAPLDEMLSGGLLEASSTLVLGAPGTGKTLLGLNFLSASQPESPGLYFGFAESPERLIAKAGQIGVSLGGREDVQLMWQPPFEQLADALAERLLTRVRARGVRRLFIDGLNGLEGALIEPSRLTSFVNALTNELRAMGVTTLISAESRAVFGPELDLPMTGISTSVETVLLLRYVELRSQLRRLVSVLKKREGAYDSSLREFSISDRGFQVAATFESAEAILSGLPRMLVGTIASSPVPPPAGKRAPKRGRS